ncbi:hypothetical protein L207DRAFT_505117 [Hyaloscypha variabilis F]|uniref:Uncharacterized protein n=1 Tax=Hyaloscypha variabilis (strain UAMH 11265 / GT02V1 / F) TaxID=1149755 RepID=A0A2J6SB73_HYAVF|nr:hypothetical protein L207DRAFT_505117 [Hyaloscypha variabilis F]
MDNAFSKFANLEVNTWAANGDSVSRDLLVRVSGSLCSRIAHHAHQPSFTTLRPHNGETADETNPCIAMIMGNAFEKNHSLLYDHLLRRDEKSEGLQNYPEDVVKCHEAFIQTVRESMEAKVEVVYGAAVRERMLQKQGYKFDLFPLWGDYDDIYITLDRESNYSNAQQGHRYRRIIVFVAHPQRFFYPKPEECARQDKLLAVAAKIAGVNFIERYYNNQKWRTIVPFNFSSVVKNKFYGILEQPQSDGDSGNASGWVPMTSMSKLTLADASTSQVIGGYKDFVFDDGKPPFSVQELRKILPVVVATETEHNYHLHKWENLADFPEIVGAWLRRQGQTLFKGRLIKGPVDIMLVYRQLGTMEGPPGENLSLAEMIYGLIKMQARMIEKLPISSLDDLIYYRLRPFDVIGAICYNCRQPMSQDTEARWAVMRLGHYVIRRRRCNSGICQGKCRAGIPRDSSIPFVWGSRPDLSAQISRRIREDWRETIRDPKDCEGKLSQPVESWCIICKENTQLLGDRTRYLEEVPRWTIGGPPKYVERRPMCLNCQSEGRPGTARFVPVDATIPSIYKKKLTSIEKTFGGLEKDVKAEILGVERTSSKNPRAPAGPRPSRAQALANKSKTLEANALSMLQNSSTAVEEEQNRIALSNIANASAFDSCLTISPCHGNLVNEVAPTLKRPLTNMPHWSSIGGASKRPLESTSGLSFLPETKSKVKQQRIA